MYGAVKSDKSDGEYATAYGSYICPHCGEPFGGSLYVTQGVVLNGLIHHAKCFLPAVQIMVGKHMLKLGFKE